MQRQVLPFIKIANSEHHCHDAGWCPVKVKHGERKLLCCEMEWRCSFFRLNEFWMMSKREKKGMTLCRRKEYMNHPIHFIKKITQKQPLATLKIIHLACSNWIKYKSRLVICKCFLEQLTLLSWEKFHSFPRCKQVFWCIETLFTCCLYHLITASNILEKLKWLCQMLWLFLQLTYVQNFQINPH